MPRIVKAAGTGITKRGVVTFDPAVPGDMDALMKAAIRAFQRTSFQHLSKSLSDHAELILRSAGLPTAIGDSAGEPGSGPTSLVEAIVLQGHPIDSPPAYAARILEILAEARRLLKTGEHNEAMALAFQVGELVAEATHKEVWESDALRGEKIVESARRGHEHVHGTAEEKAARRKAHVEAYEAQRKKGLTPMRAYRAAAKELGVSEKTIRRAVSALSG